MAINSQVSKRREVHRELTDVAFDADAQATVTIGDLKHVGGVHDVDASVYSIGGATASSGAVVQVASVGTDANGAVQVTLHAYQGGGAGTQLADLPSVTVNSVRVEAEGL